MRMRIFSSRYSIGLRVMGDIEPCSLCDREIEIFDEEAAKARFLIIREQDQIYLGGGQCMECAIFVCLRCAVKTIYGENMHRLHCPKCGAFLAGLRRTPADESIRLGAFLREPDFAAPAQAKPNAAPPSESTP